MNEFDTAGRKMDAIQLLAELTEKQQIAFGYHQLGFTQEEIGKIMGISQQMAQKHIRAAIMNFKRMMERGL